MFVSLLFVSSAIFSGITLATATKCPRKKKRVRVITIAGTVVHKHMLDMDKYIIICE